MSDEGQILVQDYGNYLSWTLHNPTRANALSPAMLRWIQGQAGQCQGRIIVLRSNLERCFSSGFDLGALATQIRAFRQSPETVPHPDQALQDCSLALREAKLCLVGLVDAPVLGAGVELLAHCDFLLVSPRASLAVPASKLGLAYHAKGLAQIQHRFGDDRCARMLLCGERLDAASLADCPRVQLCADKAALEQALAHKVAQLGACSPAVLGAHCALLRAPVASASAHTLRAYDAFRTQAYLHAPLPQKP